MSEGNCLHHWRRELDPPWIPIRQRVTSKPWLDFISKCVRSGILAALDVKYTALGDVNHVAWRADSSERRSVSTKLHDVTSQQTVIPGICRVEDHNMYGSFMHSGAQRLPRLTQTRSTVDPDLIYLEILNSVCHHHHHHHHHHHELWRVRCSACSLTLKVKLVPPLFPRASYISPLRLILHCLLGLNSLCIRCIYLTPVRWDKSRIAGNQTRRVSFEIFQ
jgi:hypothetical protein